MSNKLVIAQNKASEQFIVLRQAARDRIALQDQKAYYKVSSGTTLYEYSSLPNIQLPVLNKSKLFLKQNTSNRWGLYGALACWLGYKYYLVSTCAEKGEWKDSIN